MNIKDFLSKEPVEKPFTKDHEIKSDVHNLCNEWREGYRKNVGEEYLITPKEKFQMRKIYEEYGPEKTRKAIEYYLTNFRTLQKPEGYPSIPALYGFRRQLVLEATRGIIEKKVVFPGQYDASKMADDDWG